LTRRSCPSRIYDKLARFRKGLNEEAEQLGGIAKTLPVAITAGGFERSFIPFHLLKGAEVVGTAVPAGKSIRTFGVDKKEIHTSPARIRFHGYA